MNQSSICQTAREITPTITETQIVIYRAAREITQSQTVICQAARQISQHVSLFIEQLKK